MDAREVDELKESLTRSKLRLGHRQRTDAEARTLYQSFLQSKLQHLSALDSPELRERSLMGEWANTLEEMFAIAKSSMTDQMR